MGRYEYLKIIGICKLHADFIMENSLSVKKISIKILGRGLGTWHNKFINVWQELKSRYEGMN